MPDLVEMAEGTSGSIIMYRWAFGGRAETLEELRAKFAPGQDKCAYLVGQDAYTWDDNASDFILVGQWQGPVGPAGEGIPIEGTTGQVLIKLSNADFDATWVELTLKTTAPLSGGGRVTDSLTLDVADATAAKRGVVRIATSTETAAGIKNDVVICPATLRELLDVIRADIAAINSMAVGTVFEFAAPTPPPGALLGDGSLARIADFPELFGVIGYAHTPDGRTPPAGYFYLPDYRDKFLRGHNPSGGRKFGSEQGDAMRNITGTFRIPAHNTENAAADGAFYKTGTTGYGFYGSSTHNLSPVIGFNPSRAVPTANENRPVNKTVLICIKY